MIDAKAPLAQPGVSYIHGFLDIDSRCILSGLFIEACEGCKNGRTREPVRPEVEPEGFAEVIGLSVEELAQASSKLAEQAKERTRRSKDLASSQETQEVYK